jgi:hypothetical protein
MSTRNFNETQLLVLAVAIFFVYWFFFREAQESFYENQQTPQFDQVTHPSTNNVGETLDVQPSSQDDTEYAAAYTMD